MIRILGPIKSWVRALILGLMSKKTELTAAQIVQSLVIFQNGNKGLVQRYVLDGRYWTVDKNTFEAMVKAGWVWHRRYLTDRYDCDDFAVGFKARMAEVFGVNAVGIVVDYGAKHAYNMVILSDGTIEGFEPQAGLWCQLGSEYYPCREGVMLL